MDHTKDTPDILQQEENVEATKETPINLEEDTEENKDAKRPKRLTSRAWDHFKRVPNCAEGREKAKCNYCQIIVSCNTFANGTSSMIGHLKNSCPQSPLRVVLDKKQKILNFKKLSKEEMEKLGTTHNIQAHSFNQERLRKKVAMMCIKDNMSFSIVQHEGFIELMNEAQPLFKMPSRWTVARDCISIYKEEAMKLKECMSSQRLSFTTDTWTSIQNINYMSLSTHWVNDDWKICKRIINFCPIGSHKGVAIGKLVEALLKKWEIKCEKMVCLDVETRWNSTFMMLEVATIYESAFERMYVEDYNYEAFFKINNDEIEGDNNKKKKKKKKVEGHPKFQDFANVKCLIQFLKIFYEVTIKISGSKYCTSNLFFIELVKIQGAIIELSLSGDILTRDMATRMKEKYDKYWDNTDNTNFLLYVSVVLDPRYKMHYVKFCFGNLYGSESSKCILMCEKIMKTLKELFDHYKIQHGAESSSSTTSANVGSGNNVDFKRYMEEQVQGGQGNSEIDIYLMDGIEMEDENFDILTWWKIHSTKFPVLSKIARHVLGMPISTVASESAFSTGGRTLDAYRSRLLPRTAEALICTQDWLRNGDTFIDLRQEPEDYKKYENIEKDEFKDVQNLFAVCVIDE